MAKRVTLREIGQRAGVSNVAVGAALGLLSDTSSVRLSQAKAEMIRQVAREMGYQPNLLARAFRKQETRMVGVLFRVMSNPLSVGYMIDSLHRNLLAQSYHAYLSPYQSRFDLLWTNVLDLLAWRMDGLVLMNVFQTDDTGNRWKELETILADAGVPIVFVASDIQTDQPQPRVNVDMQRVSQQAAEHLLALGHRHLACVTKSHGPSAAREAGFHSALRGVADAKYETISIATTQEGSPIQELVLSAKATGRALARRKDRPTALICGNDIIAVSLIEAMREHGVRVPQDVSVIGYDDSDYAVLGSPQLTTFTPPIEAMTRAAVHMLLEHIKNPATRPQARLFQANLVVRGSTGPVPPAPPAPATRRRTPKPRKGS